MSAYDLVIFGDLNGDIMLTDADPTPIFGQHEKFVAGGFIDIGGGSSITAAQTARLGLKTAFAGKVGDDLQGRLLAQSLRELGVDAEWIILDPSIGTGFTVHLCREIEGDRSMLTYAGSLAHLRAEDAPLDLIRQARHFHVSDFFLLPALQEGLAGLLATVKGMGIPTSLDTAWDPSGRWNGQLHDCFPSLDVLLPNEQELYHMSGQTELESALREMSRHVPTVVAKVGSRGAVAIRDGQIYSEPGYPVDAVEGTGAGDNFNAGFLYGYVKGMPMQKCLKIGCVCGAMSTRALGGLRGQISLAELESAVGEPC